MQENTRRKLFIIGAIILFGILGFWWYTGFSLEFMRFFAAEPTKTCQPRPACLDAKPSCEIAEPADGWCPSDGCYYIEVQCIQAPCPSQLVCPSPAARMVTCNPASQTVAVNQAATLTATGGDGTYQWFAPEGTPNDFGSNSGAAVPGTATIVYDKPGTKKVTVQSGRGDGTKTIDSVACTVIVTP